MTEREELQEAARRGDVRQCDRCGEWFPAEDFQQWDGEERNETCDTCLAECCKACGDRVEYLTPGGYCTDCDNQLAADYLSVGMGD